MTEFTYTGENSRLRKSDLKTINGTSIIGSGDIVISGDTNTIETIQVNGTALTPDANKAVDIDVPVHIYKIPLEAGMDVEGLLDELDLEGLGREFNQITLTSLNNDLSNGIFPILWFASDNGNKLEIFSFLKITINEPTYFDFIGQLTLMLRTECDNSGMWFAGLYKHLAISTIYINGANVSYNSRENPIYKTVTITGLLNTSSTAQTKNGQITATKFVTSGGTSNLFVKGDGSLDSTSYATTNDIPTKTSDLTNDSNFTTLSEVTLTIVNSAPETLDTLNELAAALGDDPNFATTVATQIGQKYTKPSTGIPASDLAVGVIPDVPVQSVNGMTGAVTVKENTQADWDATSGDAVILNKPKIENVYRDIGSSTIFGTKINGNTDEFISLMDGIAISNSNYDSANIKLGYHAADNDTITLTSRGMDGGIDVITDNPFTYNNKEVATVDQIITPPVTSVNGMTGAVTVDVPVTSVNGATGAVITQLSDDYAPSSEVNENLELAAGDTYEEAFSKLEKTINDNETITAAALTDLDSKINTLHLPQSLDDIPDGSTRKLSNYATTTQLSTKQDTLISGTNIKTINNLSLLGSGNITIEGGSGGDTNVIETVKVNGTALTPDANKAVDITVPTTLDSISDGTTRKLSNYLPLSGGTMTGAITVASGDGKGLLFSTTSNINVSGTTNTILGFYNGTYIIGHTAYPVNIRGTNTRPNYNGNQLALYSDIPSEITESTVSGWGFTKNTGTVTGVKMNGITNNPTNGVVDLGTVLTSFTETDPTVPAWAKAANKPTYTAAEVGALPDTTVIPAAPGTLNTTATTAQSTSSSEALSGNITLHKVAKTGTYNDLIGKPTIPAAQVQSDWNATSGMGAILNKPTIPTVNNATLTIQKNGTTVNTFTANASSNVTANIQVNELPTVSSSDNGKILQVVNGAWALVTPVTVYTGTSTPNSSLGINGDLYVLTS